MPAIGSTATGMPCWWSSKSLESLSGEDSRAGGEEWLQQFPMNRDGEFRLKSLGVRHQGTLLFLK